MRPIRTLPPSLRPREKLTKYGPDGLSVSELICVILGSGTKKIPVTLIAKRVSSLLSKKPHPTMDDCVALGIGPVKAMQIVAALALGTRAHSSKTANPTNPSHIYALCQDIATQDREYVIAFYFNARHELLKREVLALGTANTARLLPRELFSPIKELPVASIIIAHNHPSGILEPSTEDVLFTKRVRQAGALLGIDIKDHLIVTKTGWIQI